MENLKARDIRVGNYYDHNGEYKQVTPNTIMEVWEAERSWCKPIPLTEDILLKCGFEKDGTTYHNQIAIYHIYDNFTYNVNYFEHDNLIEIIYLHQLQNLYFALTNIELEII